MTYYKRLFQASAAMILLTALLSSAQQDKQRKASQHDAHLTASTPAKAASHQAQQDDGNKVFQQHCSRCHTAPDGFSPRISGTVAMHMRVRASLSEREMQALLRFLNP